MRTRLARRYKGQPRRIGLGVGGGHNLDLVAAFQTAAQRHQLVIDLGGDTTIADVGMHGISKIDASRACRHAQNLALGRKHIHLIREQIDLDVFEEFDRITRFALQFQQRLQPLVRLLLHFREAIVAALVHPVRGHTGIGNAMHVLRADLDFNRDAIRAKQRGMQL